MAYWIVDFKGLGGDSFRVRVSGAVSDTYLNGGAVPFETVEDTSDKWFLPVRLQSGYLRVVDDDSFDWMDLIPATDVSRSVEVLRTPAGSSIPSTVWRGWLQPQTFSGQWKEYIQEREYPVMCQLSALASFDVSASGDDVVNFAGLLYYIFSQAGVWGNFYFQGVDAVTEWLLKKTLWQNLTVTDDEGIVRSNYTCMDLLTEICKFFGWTCRTNGEDVYFCCADERNLSVDWTRVTLSDLYYASLYGQLYYQTESWLSDSQCTDYFANSDNTLTILRGIRKATVTARVNRQTDDVMTYPSRALAKTLDGMSYTRYSYGDNKYLIRTADVTSFADSELNGSVMAVSGDNYASFNGEERYQGYIIKVDGHHFSHVVRIRKTHILSGDNTLASLWTTRKFLFKGGGKIQLSAMIYRGWDALGDRYTMWMRVGIGDDRLTAVWWNGTAWVSAISTFQVGIGEQIGIFKAYGFGPSGEPATVAPGINISIPTSMYGKLFVDFLGSDDVPENNNNERSFEIEGFSVTYDDSSTNENEENVYTASSGAAFRDDDSTDTIFASDNGNMAGLGIIMNDDMSSCSSIHYTTSGGGSLEHPEQHLADRMATFGNMTRKMFVLNLRSNMISDLGPRYLVYADGMTLWPLCVSRNWRNDLTNLKLVQI